MARMAARATGRRARPFRTADRVRHAALGILRRATARLRRRAAALLRALLPLSGALLRRAATLLLLGTHRLRRRLRPPLRRTLLLLRRGIATLRAAAFALAALLVPATCAAFAFDDVALRAKQLAAAAYTQPDTNLPPDPTERPPDQYPDIPCNPAQPLGHPAKPSCQL